MTPFRTVLLTNGLALALFCGAAQAQPAAQGGKPMMTLQMPTTPDPARITLDPTTTALMVLDYVENICNRQPSCKGQMLPALIPFLERVRKAGLVVAYGTREQNMTKWLKEVAPAPSDIKVISTAQDDTAVLAPDATRASASQSGQAAGRQLSGNLGQEAIGR